MGSKCASCGGLYIPPRAICIACHGSELEWVETTGAGKLIAFTSTAIAPPALAEEGYGRDNPYCTGVIELEDGVRVAARINGLDARNPERVELGTPMKIEFPGRDHAEQPVPVLAFSPHVSRPS